jgi:hypothetical protein
MVNGQWAMVNGEWDVSGVQFLIPLYGRFLKIDYLQFVNTELQLQKRNS